MSSTIFSNDKSNLFSLVSPYIAQKRLNIKNMNPPKNIVQDKETMYLSIMKLKNEINKSNEENMRLKGRIIDLENDVRKKEKILQMLSNNINPNKDNLQKINQVYIYII